MHRTLIPLATLAAFAFVGTGAAQETAQPSPDAGAGNAGSVEEMTCADLNEMQPEEAIAFLRGYQYRLTSESRTAGSGATAGETSQDSTAEPSSPDASTPADSGSPAEVGAATTTGNITTDQAADVGTQAILNSCFDVPTTSLDEVLSGAFGTLD